ARPARSRPDAPSSRPALRARLARVGGGVPAVAAGLLAAARRSGNARRAQLLRAARNRLLLCCSAKNLRPAPASLQAYQSNKPGRKAMFTRREALLGAAGLA